MIKDSGDRTEFYTGAVRDMRDGKGRCDLLPIDVICDIYEYYEYDVEPLRHIEKFTQTGSYKDLIKAVVCGNTDMCYISDMLLDVSVHTWKRSGTMKLKRNS